MQPTDEDLLHTFYTSDTAALEQLSQRLDPILLRVVYLILSSRAGPGQLRLGEWDIDERLTAMWSHVLGTKVTRLAPWPHQRLSALTWLIYLLCLEVDRHLELRPPF